MNQSSIGIPYDQTELAVDRSKNIGKYIAYNDLIGLVINSYYGTYVVEWFLKDGTQTSTIQTSTIQASRTVELNKGSTVYQKDKKRVGVITYMPGDRYTENIRLSRNECIIKFPNDGIYGITTLDSIYINLINNNKDGKTIKVFRRIAKVTGGDISGGSAIRCRNSRAISPQCDNKNKKSV